MYSKNQLLAEIEDQNRILRQVSFQYEIENEIKMQDIDSVCVEKGINTDFFLEILKIFNDTNYFPKQQLMSFPFEVIIDYLQKTHKYFFRKRLLEIEQSITQSFENEKVALFLQQFFLDTKKGLIEHVAYEERQLFPYIKALSALENKHILPSELKEIYGDYSIQVYEQNHDASVENRILEVRKYLVQIHESAESLFPFRVLLNQLDSFEKELRIHALVEDEVLIPKARLAERFV